MAKRLRQGEAGFEAAFAALLGARGARLEAAEAAAGAIVAAVRAEGLPALLRFAAEFDGVALAGESLRVSAAEIDAATTACPAELIAALELAAARIRAFHEQERPKDRALEADAVGVQLGWRWTPMDAAGLYVPGGLAAYPSSVLMNAIPAKAAGVRRLTMVTPPARLGETPAILAAARIAGVDEVFRVGGAQAIAALAYGAGPIAPCDIIVGPGNAYVAAAKKIVFGDVGIDSIAGPSEVFILAGGGAQIDPAWLAADLMAQAEHDEDAQAVLITDDAALAEAVAAAVAALLAAGEAGPAAAASWARHGAIVIVDDLAAGAKLCDRAAAEHVQIIAPAAERLAGLIRHAGAVFLGPHAPEALGDYVAGPSHVLPTARGARYASGVMTQTFMKRTSLIAASAAGLQAIGPAAARIADAEGLPAHARSIRVRLGEDPR